MQSTPQPPWQKLTHSPLQIGDPLIQVLYIESNRRREGYWRAFIGKCTQAVHPDTDPRSFDWADNHAILEADVWDYLHTTYGKEIAEGFYPCSQVLIKQAIFNTPKPRRGMASHTQYKTLKDRMAELETRVAQVEGELALYREAKKEVRHE